MYPEIRLLRCQTRTQTQMKVAVMACEFVALSDYFHLYTRLLKKHVTQHDEHDWTNWLREKTELEVALPMVMTGSELFLT